MVLALFKYVPVVVRGGGDLASGVIYRLTRAGFPVLVLERAQPLAIRRTVAFASAVSEGQITVEGLTAHRIDDVSAAAAHWAAGTIPVLVDEDGVSLDALQPPVVVDARIAKRNLGTTRDDAPLVIALGPGYTAGDDCHAVIETQRGHYLGRVIWQGAAAPNTGRPGEVQGHMADRVLRAPADGVVFPQAAIGDALAFGDVVATVEGLPVTAPFAGVLRGLIHSAVMVTTGYKIGDVDPRGVRDHCFTISDKALAVGGGVLEALLSAPQMAGLLLGE
ncbi:MAG: EF2563 family selenium-dependent molybdenum hydroxylase system protein [Anaerolineae bacterium]|nr:EF2563 family selenium-dependent molybdenum hydroxylase system protein [Anaerolineae bacterium]